MAEVIDNLQDASKRLLSLLKTIDKAPADNRCWRLLLADVAAEDFFYPIRNTVRLAFKSRDSDWSFMGLGSADILKGPDAFLKLSQKRPTLFPDQHYFAATRFDEEAQIAPEWQDFGQKVIILPIVSLNQKNGVNELILSYRTDGLPWAVWLDHAHSILQALLAPKKTQVALDHDLGSHLPTKENYFFNLKQALLNLGGDRQKVVLGRRSSLRIKNPIDPAELFFRLQKKPNAFLFFIDLGLSSTFFGASPELLYRRVGDDFETESLAGTRARSCDEEADKILRNELSTSLKDNHEHALVSLYIEEKLKELGVTNLSSTPLEVRALSYVQHLLKRFRAKISHFIDDEHIINTLHPTPAVCGLERSWAKEYIRNHEGFDRGLYAGAIGCLGKDEAEFSVSIRSALFFKQNLYIYVASGIVLGSLFEQEWDELSHKEKSMLSIFYGAKKL